ncbi:MAG TPA: dihydropteroate synthase [Thermoplasmata archaeon]|nr:dihydropteroate synthase [Thermoplasmata archaeon]
MPPPERPGRPPNARPRVRILDPEDAAAGEEGSPPLRRPPRFSVRFENVAPTALDRLRTEARSLGGELVEATGAVAGRPAIGGVTVEATGEAFDRLLLRLDGPGASMPALRLTLAGALSHRWRRSERTVRGAHRSFLVGGRTLVMGVVNVTPDSFSDGGRFVDPPIAIAEALSMVEDGADLLDVGGESTRPGATPVPPDVEWDRIAPVLDGLKGRVPIPISVDTRHAEVARRAVVAGADVVNDVSGLVDPEMRGVVRELGAAAIVMHLRGEPKTMQEDTRYDDLLGEVYGRLADALETAESDGIGADRLLVDPGLGFGKTPAQSLSLLAHLGELRSLGRPVVVGASRKSFLGWALGGVPIEQRAEAGLAAAVLASRLGADVLRTHDVGPTVRALKFSDRLRGPPTG